MKYVVVLGDGMAGRPIEELDAQTTLEAADTPTMDRLAPCSEVGMVKTIPEGMAPGSDTANLAVLGYDPKIYYTGRSPLEALSIGVDMADTDVAIRCNLVTLSEEDCPYEDRIILDHSSDEISTEDSTVLLEAMVEGLKEEGILTDDYVFYPGTSYRHLLIWKHGHVVELTPPHDILTKRIGDYLPKDEKLREMMEASYDILENHPINKMRRAKGLHPANSAWFWGAGTKPLLDSFEETYGKKGVMISAVDLLKGIATGAGMDKIIVEGANGGLDTNYEGKAEAAVKSLTEDGYDLAYVHIEAPDEMGHQGSVEKKIQAIENVDKRVLAPIIEGLTDAGEDFRVLVMPDHPTPIEIRTHSSDPIPYLLYDSTTEVQGPDVYNEKTGLLSGIYYPEGHKLMSHLLQEDK